MEKAQELHVLLVDDDEEDAFLIKDMLRGIERVKLVFHWASTYEQGAEILNQHQWSAVLVDYDLGGKNGLEFIREANAKAVKAPMIMVTGRGRYEIDLEAMQAGAVDYLTKDQLNSLFLERTIRYAQERRRTEEELERRVQERTREIQLLLDQTPSMLWVTDANLRVTSIQGKRLASLAPADEPVIGKSIRDVFRSMPPNGERKMIAAHQAALQGQSTRYEMNNGGGVLQCRG